MFVLKSAARVSCDSVENDRLAALIRAWNRWRDWRPFPRLDQFDPSAVRDNLGRLHLVEVLGPRLFRFIHYGMRVTNPDARDMTGLTTADYHDKAFGDLVATHYQEAVDARQPVCRHIVAERDGRPYEYVRAVLPMGDGPVPQFLLVGTQRIVLPDGLAWTAPAPLPADELRAQARQTRRLAGETTNPAVERALMAVAAACELRAAETEASETGAD